MSSKQGTAAMAGAGAVACAACCAGPVLGFLAALGVGTILGVAIFGVLGLIVAVVGATWLIRRRLRQAGCGTSPVEVVLQPPTTRARP